MILKLKSNKTLPLPLFLDKKQNFRNELYHQMHHLKRCI